MNVNAPVAHCDQAKAIAARYREWLEEHGATASAAQKIQRRNATIIRLDEWARDRGNPMGLVEIAELVGCKTHSAVGHVLRAHRAATGSGRDTSGVGLTQTEVGELIGLSRGRVQQIEKRALSKFRRRLAPLVLDEVPA